MFENTIPDNKGVPNHKNPYERNQSVEESDFISNRTNELMGDRNERARLIEIITDEWSGEQGTESDSIAGCVADIIRYVTVDNEKAIVLAAKVLWSRIEERVEREALCEWQR